MNGRVRPALAALAAAAALAYFVALAVDLSTLRLVAKPLPALALAAWVLLGTAGRRGALVGCGLVASACGDALLETGAFVPGLVAFLLAHVAYVAAFLLLSARPRLLAALPFVVWGAGAFLFLRPGLGALAFPVALYVAVLCSMMWRVAALVGTTLPRRAAWLALAGALAFGVSDTLIAFDRFHSAIPGVAWPIMLLYWIGQAGIAAGSALLSSRRR